MLFRSIAYSLRSFENQALIFDRARDEVTKFNQSWLGAAKYLAHSKNNPAFILQCIHKCIHICREGFEGDALILDASQPRASAFEQSSPSSVSAIGLEQTPRC